jgi:L-alanine-DL-glutamate epimerase-like enolase superfamily enzyme
MAKSSRRNHIRTLGGSLAAAAASAPAIAAPKSSDIRIDDVRATFEDFLYRAPYKFGGVAVDRATILNVEVTVTSRGGKTAKGRGSMPLGNVWSFPSRKLPYDKTLAIMKDLAMKLQKVVAGYKEFAHPLDVNWVLEPEYMKTAAALPEPAPKLCTLVTASPFDAAVHDAYGRLLGRNCFTTYGTDFVNRDMSAYMGLDFKGEFVNQYVLTTPRPAINLYHSVGGSDPLTEDQITKKVGDGLPETLPEWIRFNGLHHIKIKLQGDELAWDIERVVSIDRIAQQARPEIQWRYCVDFNERCPNVGYLLEFLRKVKEKTPRGFERIEYIEQPTARDLKADRNNKMHEAAKLRPIVIDESLTDMETFFLARDLGYTGVALKACKGQTQALLMAAAGQKYKMFLCVQDLTCPGASLIHSAAIASHIPGVSGIEANSRQYLPAANKPWEGRFPGIFVIRDGTLKTASLTGPGLGT